MTDYIYEECRNGKFTIINSTTAYDYIIPEFKNLFDLMPKQVSRLIYSVNYSLTSISIKRKIEYKVKLPYSKWSQCKDLCNDFIKSKRNTRLHVYLYPDEYSDYTIHSDYAPYEGSCLLKKIDIDLNKYHLLFCIKNTKISIYEKDKKNNDNMIDGILNKYSKDIINIINKYNCDIDDYLKYDMELITKYNKAIYELKNYYIDKNMCYDGIKDKCYEKELLKITYSDYKQICKTKYKNHSQLSILISLIKIRDEYHKQFPQIDNYFIVFDLI